MITAIPTVVSANPARTTLLERRFPVFLPAIMATANMLSDNGARESPACIALYSRVICKKIGSTIIAPPRVICCSICWEIPILKCGKREQPRVEQRRLPLTLAAYQPERQRDQPDCSAHDERRHRFAALLPDQDAQHDTAHSHDGQGRADQVDLAWAGVGDVAHELDVGEHDGDHHDLEEEADSPRQERRDEPSEQRPDRRGDRGGGTDQRVGLLPGRAVEVPMDERLHRGQQHRRPEAPEDGPEDDDRPEVLSQRHRQGADRVGEKTQARRRACDR